MKRAEADAHLHQPVKVVRLQVTIPRHFVRIELDGDLRAHLGMV